jgi:hypothetical protein
MAWCKVSSLTAAVSRTFRGANYPLTKEQVLAASSGKTLEGWELNYFLRQALRRKNYTDLRTIMTDLEDWLEAQG